MQLSVDITIQLRSGGGDSFFLHSQFTSDDRSLVLFGPSGSGKTLTLQAIAGLLTPDKGRISVNGDVFFDSEADINLPTRRRGVGYVFQDYALFPHRTVWENVCFGLKPLFGRVSKENAERVDALLELFGLSQLKHQRPGTLSGGQKQRTALARALATKPKILLLDEPFSALDQPLRLRMREELSKVLENFEIPMIMVTHDSDEVESFAQAVVVYNYGKVVGVHTTADITAQGQSVSETIRNQIALVYDTQ